MRNLLSILLSATYSLIFTKVCIYIYIYITVDIYPRFNQKSLVMTGKYRRLLARM